MEINKHRFKKKLTNKNSEFVKEKFRDLLFDNGNGALTTKGKEVFEVIWKNKSLMGNILKLSNKELKDKEFVQDSFTNEISQINNSFYKFLYLK